MSFVRNGHFVFFLLLLLLFLLGAVYGCSEETDPFITYQNSDYIHTRKLLEADQNKNKEEQNLLATLYHSGMGGVKDLEKAFYWYELSAKQGLASAQYNLALLYHGGLGIDKNNLMAYAWFHAASLQHHSLAKEHISSMAGQLTPNQIMKAKALLIKEMDSVKGMSQIDDNLIVH